MDIKLNRILGLLKKDTEEEPDRTTFEGDSLIINCRGCDYRPEPASRECLICMVDNLCRHGDAKRIVLRTGMDMEISGRSGEALRKIASLKRWSIPEPSKERSCRNCSTSRTIIMTDLWDTFPDLDFDAASSALMAIPQQEECAKCFRSSDRAIIQLKRDIDRVIADLSK